MAGVPPLHPSLHLVHTKAPFKTMPSKNPVTGTVFAIRATPSQKQALKVEAERRGLTQSQLVRQALGAAGVPLWAAAGQ